MSTPPAAAAAVPQAYSRRQAAAILGLSEHTLARMAKDRRGPAYSRSGPRRGRALYAPADLAAWLEQTKVSPTPRGA